jgi:hypothetical protein
VPEAPVNKHRDLGGTEDNVSSSSHAGKRKQSVDAVAQTHGVKQASELELGLGVLGLLQLHSGSDTWRRGPGRSSLARQVVPALAARISHLRSVARPRRGGQWAKELRRPDEERLLGSGIAC